MLNSSQLNKPALATGPGWAIASKLAPSATIARLEQKDEVQNRLMSMVKGGGSKSRKTKTITMVCPSVSELQQRKTKSKLVPSCAEEAFTYHLLRDLVGGGGAFPSMVFRAIKRSQRRPEGLSTQGSPLEYLFDTFTDHLLDLLLEQNLASAIGGRDGWITSTEKLREPLSQAPSAVGLLPRELKHLTREALRRTFNTYAEPTQVLLVRQPMGSVGTA